jgi:cbb3-type cytochrome c oxidase subunit III
VRYAGLVVGIACAAVVALALSACGSGGSGGSGGFVSSGSQGAGKVLFTERCAGCHTLADAGSSSTIGPNLDDAFEQSRNDGMTTSTFTQVVAGQIRFPIENTSTGAPGMPGVDSTLPSCDDVAEGEFCVQDQDQAVADVATYVGAVAGTGITAEKPTDGKAIFTANCGACHTLADAGTTGKVGPNLDDAKPAKDAVKTIVTNGRGAMPAFSGSLDAQQIEAVADYVASSAGK